MPRFLPPWCDRCRTQHPEGQHVDYAMPYCGECDSRHWRNQPCQPRDVSTEARTDELTPQLARISHRGEILTRIATGAEVARVNEWGTLPESEELT